MQYCLKQDDSSECVFPVGVQRTKSERNAQKGAARLYDELLMCTAFQAVHMGNDWRRSPFGLTAGSASLFKSCFDSRFEQNDRRTHPYCHMYEGRMLMYGYLLMLRGTEPARCTIWEGLCVAT
jgi:hypothetical protein